MFFQSAALCVENAAPHLVEVAELPEENQQLLVELDLLGGLREVSLDQGVVEQPSQPFEDEAQVLMNKERADLNIPLYRPVFCLKGRLYLTLPLLCVSWRDNSQRGCQVQLAGKEHHHF